MALIPMLISLASGAIGGNVAGSLMKKFSLGTIGNSIAGIAGGGLGGSILSMIPGLSGMAAGGATGDAETGLGVTSILSSVASGGVGGGAVMGIIGMIKNAMGK